MIYVCIFICFVRVVLKPVRVYAKRKTRNSWSARNVCEIFLPTKSIITVRKHVDILS